MRQDDFFAREHKLNHRFVRVWLSFYFFTHIAGCCVSGAAESLSTPVGPLSPVVVWVRGGHSGSVNSVAYSPDGSLIASGSGDWTVKLWNIPDETLSTTLVGHNNPVLALAFSPDGQTLASGDKTEIRLWRVSDRVNQRTFRPAASPTRLYDFRPLQFSPDGAFLAAGYGLEIELWSLTNAARVQVLSGHTDVVTSLSYAPNGRLLASGSWDKTVRLWDFAKGTSLVLTGHPGGVRSVAFSPNNQIVASAGFPSDKSIRLWSAPDGLPMRTLESHSSAEITSLAFAPDGQLLAAGVGAPSNAIEFWRVSDGLRVSATTGSKSRSVTIAFSPDSKNIVSSSGETENQVVVWKVPEGIKSRSFVWQSGAISSLAFSADGELLVSATDWYNPPKLSLWSVHSGTLLRTFHVPERFTGTSEDPVYSVAFAPDSKMIASGGYAVAHLWRVADGALLKTLRGHSSDVRAIRYSPDGETIITGSMDHTVRLWGVKDGTLLQTFGHEFGVTDICLSHDGKLLVSGLATAGDNLKIWRMSDGVMSLELLGHRAWVGALAASPTGDIFASAGESGDGTIKIWRLSDGALEQTLSGHDGGVVSLSFSSDGRFLASAGQRKGNVKIWRLSDGAELSDLADPFLEASVLDFSQDGLYFAVGRRDATLALAVNSFMTTSKLHLLLRPPGIPEVQFQGEMSRSYTIQSTTNLVTWEDLVQVRSSNTLHRILDPSATNASFKFYRARSP